MVIFLVLGLKNVKLSDKFYILLNLTKKSSTAEHWRHM